MRSLNINARFRFKIYGNSIQIPCISKTWIAAFLQFRTLLLRSPSAPRKVHIPRPLKFIYFVEVIRGKPTHATGPPIPNLSEATTTSCSKTKFIDGMKKENLAVLCSPPAPRKVHVPKTIKVSSFDKRKSHHSKPDMMSVMVQANEQDIKASMRDANVTLKKDT